MTPAEIVTAAETRHGLPEGSLDRVWSVECSRQQVGGAACRNRRSGERGAFQMTSAAAADVGCNWTFLGQPGRFAFEADCAAKYLARLLVRCGDIQRAFGAYNAGRCTSKTAYVRKVVMR